LERKITVWIPWK
jgi:hypothetical protein